MAKDTWDPAQYERFATERAQPFWELLAMVQPDRDPVVLDLGCGSGELTNELHMRLKASRTLGIDSSEAMLGRARTFSGPSLEFAHQDIQELNVDGRFDLVFSNAALQWVGGHERLFARLRSLLAPGGQLAIQMPDNFDMITHTVAAEVAREEQFASHLPAVDRRREILTSERYALLLHELGFSEQRVCRRVYGHLLDSREEIITWVKGSLMTEYRRLLPPPVYERFLARYRETLLPRLSDNRPYFLAFPRLLMHGRLSPDR